MAFATISPGDIKVLLDKGTALNLIDVRTPGEFARVHARGARLIPLDRLDPGLLAGQVTARQPTYVICQSGARAAIAGQRLIDAGMSNVYSVEGGTAAWEKQGLAVERGRGGTISMERQVRIGAGALVLLGLVLARMIHPAFAGLSALVGAGLMFAGITGYCGMAVLLAKLPWNR